MFEKNISWFGIIISRQICLAWKRYQPNDQTKDMACRYILLLLEKEGFIKLPAGRHSANNERRQTKKIRLDEHTKEDIILPKRKVTKYIRPVFKCCKCNKLVRGGLGADEIPNAYIGPQAKAFANYLRYSIGIPQHKIKKIFTEMFDLPFDQTSVPGFENQLTRRAEPIYNEMCDLFI
ncbi:MAG: hypothetical protein ABH952_10605 [Candidatus Omnitrophota bacterium]